MVVGLFAVNTAGYAAERTITLRDWTGRGFAPEVVGYEVPAAGAEKLRMAGPDGKPLPVQIAPGGARDRALLLFPADLPRDATVAYQVSDRGESGSAEAGVKAAGETIVLFNSLLAVCVPKAQERTGAAVKSLPPPILAFQSAGGPWRGAGKMLGEAKAETFRVIQAAAGPVRAEIRYEIDYAGGGMYCCTVRVDAREPIAEVFEEYDLARRSRNQSGPDFQSGQDSLKSRPTTERQDGLQNRPTSGASDAEIALQYAGWELDLAAGWQPQQAEWIRGMGNGGYEVETKSLAEFASKDVKAGGGGYGTGGTSKQPGESQSGGRHICRLLAPDSNWSGDQANYIGLSADKTLAGVVLLHKGSWRRSNNLPVWSSGSTLAVQFPIGCRPLSWLAEITSESSPFSMHEHDPNLPATFGRRVWGLQLAAVDREPKGSRHGDGVFFRGRVFYGILGLDRYKDLVLSWEDKQVAYPRLFLCPDELERMKRQWQNSPVKEGLAKLYMVTGDESRARTELARTLVMSSPNQLTRPMLLLDGQVWASGIPDEPAPWRGRSEVQFGLAAGVESGKQDLKVVQWQWPAMPPAPARAALP
jgi:hypothetical protein